MSALSDRIAEVLHESLHATGFDYLAAAEAVEAELGLTEETEKRLCGYDSQGFPATAPWRRWVSAWSEVQS